MNNDRKITWSVVGGACLFWLVVILLFATSGLYGQEVLRPAGRRSFVAATPTPDPCAACPDPGGFSCQMWPEICYQCWEDCGRPIATPTPTPIPTRAPTPTPTPNPHTILCSPELRDVEACDLVVMGQKQVRSKLYWNHSADGKTYYTATTDWAVFENTVAPIIVKGSCPVAAEWHMASETTPDPQGWAVVQVCGTAPKGVYPHIFKDGFEGGTTDAWSVVVP